MKYILGGCKEYPSERLALDSNDNVSKDLYKGFLQVKTDTKTITSQISLWDNWGENELYVYSDKFIECLVNGHLPNEYSFNNLEDRLLRAEGFNTLPEEYEYAHSVGLLFSINWLDSPEILNRFKDLYRIISGKTNFCLQRF